MKKIVSLLLATAVIFCMGITSFASNSAPFVADGDKEVAVGSGTADVVVNMGIDLDSDVVSGGFALIFDFNGSKGISVKEIDESSINTYFPRDTNYSDPNSGMFYYMKADASSVAVPAGKISIPVTFTVDNTKETDYTVTLTSDSFVADKDGAPINDCVTYPTVTISVKAAAPAVKTITPSATTKLTTDEFADGTKTDVQIGTAVGMKFEQPAGVTFTKMIWALTTDAGKRYSKAVDLNLSDVTGEVALGATFINGSHANEGMGITTAVTPLTINAVNAIFTDGTNNYFTDAADAAEQK